MHPSLRFGLRNALHPVDARLIFHKSVHILSHNIEDDLFKSTHGSLCKIDQFHLPAFCFREFAIHPVEVAGKNTCFVPAGSSTAQAIRNGQAIENLERSRRNFAEGTHEPLVYFRDASGKIAIPPDPTILPPGVERLEANSLRAIDSVMSELNLDHLRDFEDTGEFQAGLEEMAGSPRQYLVDRLNSGDSMSNIQRDTMRLMISELDDEQRNRGRITSETRHHAGGY